MERKPAGQLRAAATTRASRMRNGDVAGRLYGTPWPAELCANLIGSRGPAQAMKIDTLSVVLVTYNRANGLERMLRHLQACAIPERIAVEIVIVDNNSSDKTSQVIAEFGRGSKVP